MLNPNFLIIDSGIGGLSILQEIQHQIPGASACYVADNAAFPYGTQEESNLVARLLTLMPLLQRITQPDIIIIACNTASTIVLDPLRAQTRTPIIGVVPAIKPAAQLSRNQHIALLATPGTIQRQYTQRLIQDFASDCTVIKIGSSELVEEAERKFRGLPVRPEYIKNALAPLAAHLTQIDVLVLGCTHFPFLKEDISAQLPSTVKIIDSGNAIARRAAQLLEEMPLSSHKTAQNLFFFTEDTPGSHILEPGISHFGFDKVQFIGQNTIEFPQNPGAS